MDHLLSGDERETVSSIRRTHFQSVEEFEAALRSVWDVEITQAEAGPGGVTLWSTTTAGCLVYGGAGNRAMVYSGRRSEGYWTLTPITRLSACGRYRGQVLEDGDLLFLDPGGEVFQQTREGHRQHAISIPVTMAERIVASEHGLPPESIVRQWSRKKAPRASARLERLLVQLLSGKMSACTGTHFDEPELVGQVIAETLSGSAPQTLRSSLANRRRIVSQAEELIRTRLNHPPNVTELCEATYASRRLLFNAFNELLGRSPIAHIRILRLHAARRRIRADANEANIQEIAAELGFFHPGQFALYYSRCFGESPSQTRRFWQGFSFARESVLEKKTRRT